LHQQLIADVLAQYPDKSRKRRQKHLAVAKPIDAPEAEAELDFGGFELSQAA
jgi:nitrogenase molybdenum-iron protein alpha chain